MTDVDNYVNGKVVDETKLGLFLLKFSRLPLIGSLVRNAMIKGAKKYEPKTIDLMSASRQIMESGRCASGERVCRVIHPDSAITESVFLDELAEGMVGAGKAKYTTKENAINILKKHSKNHPLILSTVDNKPMEICCSSKETCIYWNMERNGLKCVNMQVLL